MAKKPRRLSADQLIALRATPIDATTPNRVRVALALTRSNQMDLSRQTGLRPATVSEVVRGLANMELATAQLVANYFGCLVDDLFPIDSKRIDRMKTA